MLSRVADSLYWMARYAERAEHTARLIAVKLESQVEQSSEDARASWMRTVSALSGEKFVTDRFDAYAATNALAFERTNPSSLVASLKGARDNARQVREQLSTEVWEQLNRLYLGFQPVTLQAFWNHQPAEFFRGILRDLHTFEGVAFSTLGHGEGWYFLELGRYIERAQAVSRLLDLYFAANFAGRPHYFDWLMLLKFCSAFEPYCKVHTAAIAPERIAEFLVFDRDFPHSLSFAVDRIGAALSHVAPGAPAGRRAACERLAGRLKASVDFGHIDELMKGSIALFLAETTRQCERIHDAVYATYIAYGAESVL